MSECDIRGNVKKSRMSLRSSGLPATATPAVASKAAAQEFDAI